MEVKIMKSCDACIKKDVCKYAVVRKDLESKVTEKTLDTGVNDPFLVTVSCSGFANAIRERGI